MDEKNSNANEKNKVRLYFTLHVDIIQSGLLDITELGMYVLLKSFVGVKDSKRIAEVSITQIVNITGMRRQQVADTLKSMVRKGIIEKVEVPHGCTSQYKLTDITEEKLKECLEKNKSMPKEEEGNRGKNLIPINEERRRKREEKKKAEKKAPETDMPTKATDSDTSDSANFSYDDNSTEIKINQERTIELAIENARKNIAMLRSGVDSIDIESKRNAMGQAVSDLEDLIAGKGHVYLQNNGFNRDAIVKRICEITLADVESATKTIAGKDYSVPNYRYIVLLQEHGKNQYNNYRTVVPKTSFSNFEQRDYDEEALERMLLTKRPCDDDN